ncbi:hypothetical protein [Arenibacter echinorum]|nr:hypothetical protein [Arenibacter echinorum]
MISMVGWVAALLFMEFLFDLGWLFSSILWWISNKRKWLKITLRLAATAIILHAIRVLIFILGRVGPWIDFDYRPEYRPLQYSDRTWIYFAAIMSILGVIGVIVVWIARRHLKTRKGSQ